MFKSGAQMMILVLLTGLVLMRESRQEPAKGWDDGWADFLAVNSRREQTTAPVVLVGIDNSSLQDHPWPWSPLDFSLFFQAIFSIQPEVASVDEVLNWNRFGLAEDQARKLPQYEKILRDNILRTPKVLLGARLGFPEDPQIEPPWQEVPLLRNVSGDLSRVVEFPIVEHQPPEDFRLSATIGFTNLPPVVGQYNSVPLVFRYRGQLVPAFTLQAVMLWGKLTPDEVKVVLGDSITLGTRRIPIDDRGMMRVDFSTKRGFISFEELLLASEQVQAGAKPVADLSPLKGSIALLARTDSGEKGSQTLPLAARRMGSPGELFGAAIATIQNQSFIRRSPLWLELAVLAAVIVFGAFLPRWSRFAALFLSGAALAVYALVSMAVFNGTLVWLPGVMPVGTLLIALVFRLLTPTSAPAPEPAAGSRAA